MTGTKKAPMGPMNGNDMEKKQDAGTQTLGVKVWPQVRQACESSQF